MGDELFSVHFYQRVSLVGVAVAGTLAAAACLTLMAGSAGRSSTAGVSPSATSSWRRSRSRPRPPACQHELALIRLDRPVTEKPTRIADAAGPAGTSTRTIGFGTISDKPKAMACFGDPGGPQLQKGRNEKWELIGVTSGPGVRQGSLCPEGPGLYTNAPAYAKWIQTTMKTNKAPVEGGAALAKTGAHNTALIVAGAGGLVLAGGGTIVAARYGKARRSG